MGVDNTRSAELAAKLAKHFPESHPVLLARAVVASQKAAATRKRWDEYRCSFPVTEEQENRRDKRDANKVKRINAQFAEAGCAGVTLRLGGDPRGPCGWLTIPGLSGDGWAASDGFGLY